MTTAAVQTDFGLSSREAATRLIQHGPNILPQHPPLPLWRRFLEQFRSPLIYILLFALVVDLAIWILEGHSGWPFESFAVALILLMNSGLGVYQESKAEAALARLKTLAESNVWVIRDGRLVRLPSAHIVPGDVVRIEAGDRVPADGRLVRTSGVAVDESIVTGESLPIEKVHGDEMINGTLLVRGKGHLEVERTGPDSTAGCLATMIQAVEAEQTPLEKRLAVFGSRVARLVIGFAAVIALAGL